MRWRVVLGVLACVAVARADDAADIRSVRVQSAGREVAIGDLVGDGPAIVSLWMSYCLPCRAEAPTLNAARKRWTPDALRLVVVSGDLVDRPAAANLRKVAKLDVDVLPIVEGQEDAAEACAPNGYPTNFLVEHGTVRQIDRVLRMDDVEGFMKAHTR